MPHRMRTLAVCAAIALSIAFCWTGRPRAAALTTFQFNILDIRSSLGTSGVAPGQLAVIRFSVTNPSTGTAYDLQSDPAWTQTATGNSRLFLQVGWTTAEFTNVDSGSNSVGGRGAGTPIPINALGANVVANGDGTYSATSPLPLPASASGSGGVILEGHPAGQDSTGAWTLRVPVRSVVRYFAITGTTAVPRRQIVDANKCLGCHRSDGTGAAPQLTVHGNNRTEEPQVCVMCHNPNATDIVFRLATDPKVVIGRNSYAEQSLDFKRLIHGIHASSRGFRRNPLVVIAFNHTVFDASTLTPFPNRLSDCAACHIDNGTRGTFELPLASSVLGPTFDTRSFNATGVKTIDTSPDNDVKISPIAAVCSSCHDDRETLDHMVRTGGASFNTTLASLQSGAVRERCATCHGPRGEESVRRVHRDD